MKTIRVRSFLLLPVLCAVLVPPALAASIEITVVEAETGQPVAGARLEMRMDDEELFKRADGGGKFSLALPDSPTYVGVSAAHEGRVPMRWSWSKDLNQALETAITIPLPKGQTIGGVVVDEAGEPVSRAFVHLIAQQPALPKGERLRSDVHGLIVRTGSDGRWTCDQIPADVTEVLVRLEHRDFASTSHYGEVSASMTDFLAQEARFVLTQGGALQGRVLDAAGNPVGRAEVKLGGDRWGSNYPKTRTKTDGSFSFPNTQEESAVVTVQAKGYAPNLTTVAPTARAEPLSITLGPANTIRGRVVDSEGQPVAGVTVVADTWRGCRSISYRTKTDAEGAWTWNEAPSDAVEFDVLKEGFMSVRGAALAPQEAPHEIVMHPPLVVTGAVTDAVTGAPLTAFKAIPGIDWGDGRLHWEDHREVQMTGGIYELVFDYPREGGHLVRIDAEGYLPQASRIIKDDEGRVTIDFAMQPGEELRARVINADGQPVAGAWVGLAMASQALYIQDGEIPRNSDVPEATTGEDGVFSLPPQLETWQIVVIHEQGYAEADEAALAAGDITLTPWSRVEGTVYTGTAPAKARTVALWYVRGYDPAQPQVGFHASKQADDEGHFVFERVRAQNLSVGMQVELGGRRTATTQAVTLRPKPGETSRVQIGGKGRPVVGKLVVPADAGREIAFGYGYQMITNEIPQPAGQEDAEDPQQWWNDFMVSEEGLDYLAQRRQYAFTINPDGTFRADDVAPGVYTLSAQVNDPPTSEQMAYGETIGRASMEFTVPPIEGADVSEEPLDLGKITVALRRIVEVGQPAPGFEAVNLAGGTLNLNDFKGKYVLLDFWAVWCGPCRGEMPFLKAVFDKFGADERFVLISLSLDANQETPRKYAEENELGWTHGFLGDWSKTGVPGAWGINGIPAIFLIDPDGKIVAKDLRGPFIGSAVLEVLGNDAAK